MDIDLVKVVLRLMLLSLLYLAVILFSSYLLNLMTIFKFNEQAYILDYIEDFYNEKIIYFF